eukprot:TRINITY_DN14263_c0_g1_i2.p1 TRINITY_DN14263_c0_g1~~TRINITY_DN14263_c0_g1_i2.p1  ORF type:complete len:371 (+),score=54.69 TRINITY_DN14263_c0_g1_i2:80-1114(+)
MAEEDVARDVVLRLRYPAAWDLPAEQSSAAGGKLQASAEVGAANASGRAGSVDGGVSIDRRVFRKLRRRKVSNSAGANNRGAPRKNNDVPAGRAQSAPRSKDGFAAGSSGGLERYDDEVAPQSQAASASMAARRHSDLETNLDDGWRPWPNASSGAQVDSHAGHWPDDARDVEGLHDGYHGPGEWEVPYDMEPQFEDDFGRQQDMDRYDHQRPQSAPAVRRGVRDFPVFSPPPRRQASDFVYGTLAAGAFSPWASPPKLQGPRRSDRVARGAQMRAEWGQDRFLQRSACRKFDLRGCGRSAGHVPARRGGTLLIPEYVPPHEKRRDGVRQQVRRNLQASDFYGP